MIFRIFQIRQQIKDGKAIFNDPAGAAKGAAKGIIWGYIINFIVVTVLIYGGIFVLGFTGLLGGPYGFVKVLFILLFIPALFATIAGISFYKNIRRGISNQGNQTKTDGKVIDVKIN